ncbi:MAG: flagellar hook-associated protein FlgL [Lachnospiraceae bacterium]|nr:flagellar hook-associated protein FlgL [Lachnospiraceae bacterium]
MRITNKIMQNNNLSNINTNKVYQDKLSTQMSTQKKINRPSDDPVVAIRALRLRSSVTEISQYYTKNIPDANSWLNVTEDGLNNLTSILTNMRTQAVKGANGDLTTTDRKIILEQLRALSDEVYSTANADYAGRYVFAGYRTDTPIAFTESTTKRKYDITEQIDNKVIDDIVNIDMANSAGDKVIDLNAGTYNSININETDIQTNTVHRLRLSYGNCDPSETPVIQTMKLKADGTPDYDDGKVQWVDIPANEVTNSYDKIGSDTPYEYISQNPDKVVFLADTGELLLGDKVYTKLMAIKDAPGTGNVDESEIRVKYTKTDWNKGDLRPEHFFACTATNYDVAGNLDPKTTINYNDAYLDWTAEEQVIEYDVGFNQTIRVNATAKENFQPGIKRDTEDLIAAMQEVQNIEDAIGRLEKLKEETSDATELATLETQLDAANKAFAFAKDNAQKLYEHAITKYDKYLDTANLAVTETGTRSKKLELIENRMQNQKTTFETLKSENEDIDITEVAINLNSAELTYEAALMATGKVMQSTLLNYI